MDLFVLEEKEKYDKRCGEMFFTTKGRVVLHCSLCDDKFILFKAFFSHFLDMHLPDEVESVDDDLIEIDYSFEEIEDISFESSMEYNDNKQLYSYEENDEINKHFVTVESFDVPMDGEIPTTTNVSSIDQIQGTESRTDKKSTKDLVNNWEIPIKVRDVQSRLFPRSKLTPIEERKHKCPICDFGFKSRHNMIHHLKRHTDKKDHKCLECSKAFYTSSELKVHMRCHENGQERSFLCTECGVSFYDNCDLIKHMKRHSGIKDVDCNICDKKFYDNDQLRNHMKIHASNRPFICKVCKTQFKDLRRLQSHTKSHETKLEFTCTHCGEAFNRKCLLMSHVNTRHKENKK